MPENQSFFLGEREFPIGSFTIGQLQSLVPLFSTGGTDTASGVASMVTAIHHVAKASAPEMTFEEFQKIPDASVAQLLTAFQKIGLAIGYFRPTAPPAPGDQVGKQTAIATDDGKKET